MIAWLRHLVGSVVWILHVFGYEFAPRYRDFHKKMSTLVGFRAPESLWDSLIRPTRKINESLITRSGRTFSGLWRRWLRRM